MNHTFVTAQIVFVIEAHSSILIESCDTHEVA